MNKTFPQRWPVFRRVEEVLGWHEVIAEDLGYGTGSVRELVRKADLTSDPRDMIRRLTARYGCVDGDGQSVDSRSTMV